MGLFDVGLLGGFVSTAQQQNDHVVAPREIHPIARAVMNTQLEHSGAYGFGIALVAQHESFEAKDDAGLGVPVSQGSHPVREGGGALQSDHAPIVAYKARPGIPERQRCVTFVGRNIHKRTAPGRPASITPHHQSSHAGMDDSFINEVLKYLGATGAGGVAAAFFLRWCSAFVGAMFEDVGIASSRFESARSWESWGRYLPRPVYGCVVTFSRPGGGGHVGFVVGQDVHGNLLVLGGNQENEVNVRAFSRRRVTSYRWPAGVALDERRVPPVLAAVPSSTSEA